MIRANHNLRLFVDETLNHGARFYLSQSQAHYVINVMRSKAGDGIFLFNGLEGEWLGILEVVNKKNCLVELKDQIRVQISDFGPWLAFAPLKKQRTNFIVEKATELGVQRICPVFTQNTNFIQLKTSRMQMHAIEASEQSRRLTVPKITKPQSLKEFLEWWPKDRRLFVLDESGVGQPIIKAFEDLRSGSGELFDDCGFLTGPEGGFDVGELVALRKLNFVISLDLGSRILRAETAAVSAIACWQALVGSNN